jgi:ClpP class serine protease
MLSGDYVSDSKRVDELMGIYRQLARLKGLLKEHDVRAWKTVESAAAKVLRQAKREMKELKGKRKKK